MIELKDLMVIEKMLLEINDKFKFELPFNVAFKLYKYLTEIGEITDYVFQLQEEFGEKYDILELEKYHDKIMNETVSVNANEYKSFLDSMNTLINKNEFDNIVTKNKFWE